MDHNLNNFQPNNFSYTYFITRPHLIITLQDIAQNLVKNNLPLPVKYANIAQYLKIIELEPFQTQSDLMIFDNRSGLNFKTVPEFNDL